MKKVKTFQQILLSFTAVNYIGILHRRVCVMCLLIILTSHAEALIIYRKRVKMDQPKTLWHLCEKRRFLKDLLDVKVKSMQRPGTEAIKTQI